MSGNARLRTGATNWRNRRKFDHFGREDPRGGLGIGPHGVQIRGPAADDP